MDDPELNEAVEKLHQELEGADDLDDEAREQLHHLEGHIRAVLAREQASEEDDDELFLEQIGESIQRYEASHPSLTAAVQHALEILSGAGI